MEAYKEGIFDGTPEDPGLNILNTTDILFL